MTSSSFLAEGMVVSPSNTEGTFQTDPPKIDTIKDLERRQRFDVLYGWSDGLLRLDKTVTLLEFGVGKNGFSDFYAELCKSVYGLDIVDFSAFHSGRGFKFMQYDGTTIPLPDGSVDVVATHSVLEHVDDINSALAEIDRIVKVGGRIFMTVSPLYYSAWGSHIRGQNSERIDNWEHLDPDSIHYMSENPLKESDHVGHSLNKMVMSDMLSAIGMQPWNIVVMERRYEGKQVPSYVKAAAGVSKLDLVTKEFRIIAKKTRKVPV